MPAPTVAKSAASARPAVARNAKSPATKKAAPNASILSFFKKAPPPEDSMFVRASSGFQLDRAAPGQQSLPDESAESSDLYESSGSRYNESPVAAKRQKVDHDAAREEQKPAPGKRLPRPAKQLQRGPFLDDSDSDDESLPGVTTPEERETKEEETKETDGHPGLAVTPDLPNSFDALLQAPHREPETERKEDALDDTEFGELDGAAWDDEEDVSFEGEEHRERRYMEEQSRLEAAEARSALGRASECASVASCPICGCGLADSTPNEATIHVNACLDGGGDEDANDANDANDAATKQPLSALAKRFSRPGVPRPGQANPFSVGRDGGAPQARSAFAQLMSGHAEDAAWATAAAAETAARGKPSYERTCPFYKIMPGLTVCVDAFRYGAVAGCQAYFLSHFHSDHYAGLTARWTHGPIYCSGVTASLVRTQLRTAARFVVALPFEQTVDVPGTDGVRVTLIPANHCPGSALFLFEKTLPGAGTGTGTGARAGARRAQRILHCGDFRACPAHVQHPLLRPSTVDALSGAARQQRIDVCYLDTTYLNPRYAFPPQSDVIAACASLCAALDRSLRAGCEGECDRLLGPPAARAAGGDVSRFFVQGAAKPPSASKTTPTPTPTSVPHRNRLLVVCGTYSIGKERICKAIAQALGTKIYASPAKRRIIAQLDDPELAALMTSDATEAQVHMQMLMELRAETLAAYLDGYRSHFSRIVGFRPSGWTYRPAMANNGGSAKPTSSAGAGAPGVAAVAAGANLAPGSIATTSLLHGAGWRTRFGPRDLVPQRGSTREAACFGVPYSEHSSFRELALFVLALRIDKIVPTVNVGSEPSRRRMKGWLDRWTAERRKGGIVAVLPAPDDRGDPGADAQGDAVRAAGQAPPLWDGKDGKGGGAYW